MLNSRADKAADPAQLKIENELLSSEVRRLREDLATLRNTAAGRRAAKTLDDEADQELQAQALTDMRWLMSRLGNSPLKVVLRSRPGFRTLMEKYSES